MSRPRRSPTIPTVSVLIPAYNAARWLDRTLDSVLAQTVADIEVIVVDDGSPDDTAEIVRRRAATDPRVRLIQQPNGGVTRARNLGLAEARAPFIAPIDSDDIWHPTRLAVHLAAFEAGGDDVGLVYSSYRRVDEHDRVFWTVYGPPLEGEVFVPHLIENFIGNGSGITVRTAALREVGGYPFTADGRPFEIAEDWLMQMRIARRYRIVRAPGFLVGYRAVTGSLSGDRLRRRQWDMLALDQIASEADDVPGWVFWFPTARATCKLAWEFNHVGRRREALATLWRHTLTNPLVPFYLAYMVVERIGWKLFPALIPKSQTHFIPEAERRSFYDWDPAITPARYTTVSAPVTLALYRWLGRRYPKSTR